MNSIYFFASEKTDHEKAFVSIEYKAIFKALRAIGINEAYVTILEDIFTGRAGRTHMDHQVSEEIRILKGVSQGDPICPKISTAKFRRSLKCPAKR